MVALFSRCTRPPIGHSTVLEFMNLKQISKRTQTSLLRKKREAPCPGCHFRFNITYKPPAFSPNIILQQISSSLRPGTKGFTCGKWFIGYNFGIDDGTESKFGSRKELIVLVKNIYSIIVVLTSHVICHVTILLKLVNYWPIGGRFKKRNRAITFF